MSSRIAVTAATLVLALAMQAVPSAWAAGAHVHGEVRMDVAVDGPVLAVALSMPLDTLVGFEHSPRNARQRQAAADALARVRDLGRWLRPSAQARCGLVSVALQAGALEPGPGASAEPAHGDLELQAEYRCEAPQALERIELDLFERFPRAQRVEVQLAVPAGQWRQTLRKPQRELSLRR